MKTWKLGLFVFATLLFAGALGAPPAAPHRVPLRFHDNRDGTVTDLETRLVWLKDMTCPPLTNWYDSQAFVEQLHNGVCGLTDRSYAGDWRMPTERELLQLVDYAELSPCLSAGAPFLTPTEFYELGAWSTTDYSHDDWFAWIVHFYGGETLAVSKEMEFYLRAWPVRSSR